MSARRGHARILGPYQVGPKVGGGGMAAVYLGQYLSHPGEEVPPEQRVVALKIIKDELVDHPDYVHMFLDEASILSRLSHPNLIHTVGFGAQAGCWFIAMELLMGRSLMDVWDKATAEKVALPFDVAAWIAREVARGLNYAHELTSEEDGHPLHLIHRDVNPTNVFIRYDGTVKLIDFGLAKSRGRKTKSAEGIIKGKFPYLSPEQVTDNVIDHRTDIYALGATLWELTTGKRLFKRDTDVATVRAIQKGEVPDPRTFVDGYPTALWKIVERALWKDKAGRYPTASDFADDLDAFLGSRSDVELRARLAKLVADLFPGEEAKQVAWLAEATDDGDERATFVPPVPLAEVPERTSEVTFEPPSVAAKADARDARPAEDLAEAARRDGTNDEPRDDEAASDEPRDGDEAASDEPADGEGTPRPRPPRSEFMRFVAYGAVAGVLFVGAWLALR